MANFYQCSESYRLRVKKAIFRKKKRIIKRAHLDGIESSKENSRLFLEKFQESIRLIGRTKIDLIEKNTLALLQNELELNPETIISMTARLLKNIAEHTDVEIVYHPTDAAVVRNSIEKISDQSQSIRRLTVLEDASFIRGSIVIKANKSIIDAHISTQIEQAKKLILGSSENKNGPTY